MSAFAYINIEDVPADLRESSAQHPDEVTGAPLVAYDGCPLVGQIVPDGEGGSNVEYPFPRVAQIRNDLVAWLFHHGISFTVAM